MQQADRVRRGDTRIAGEAREDRVRLVEGVPAQRDRPISPDDLESLEESLDILRDPDLAESITRSRYEAREGKRSRLRDHVEG